MIYVTGDTHGSYKRLRKHFERLDNLSPTDILVVLGDTGLNYYGDLRDEPHLRSASRLPLTLLCLRGNHDRSPETVAAYQPQSRYGGQVFADNEHPSLLFAPPAEIYRLEEKTALIIGGAYSIDKQWRLDQGYNWFDDEQISAIDRRRLESRLDMLDWRVEVVFSHTCPSKYMPEEAFFQGIDQRTVDKSTELWLDELEERLCYRKWFCGHFHIDKKVGPIQFLYHEIISL